MASSQTPTAPASGGGAPPFGGSSGGSDAIIRLTEYAKQMKEGEEFECEDPLEGGSCRFGKFDGVLWKRGWDEDEWRYRWFLYKTW